MIQLDAVGWNGYDASMDAVNQKIRELAEMHRTRLRGKFVSRTEEMKSDNNEHYLIYKILGVGDAKGQMIDQYQNVGRFLYAAAGAFLEEAAILCMEEHFSNVQRKVRIPNGVGDRPKTFEIDCLVGNDAYEIKWRDATTDGDHVAKEHARLLAIKQLGYTPIRIMFYYPQREQSRGIQKKLEAAYSGVGGHYFYAESAWKHILNLTGIDLLRILEKLAEETSDE